MLGVGVVDRVSKLPADGGIPCDGVKTDDSPERLSLSSGCLCSV